MSHWVLLTKTEPWRKEATAKPQLLEVAHLYFEGGGVSFAEDILFIGHKIKCLALSQSYFKNQRSPILLVERK